MNCSRATSRGFNCFNKAGGAGRAGKAGRAGWLGEPGRLKLRSASWLPSWLPGFPRCWQEKVQHPESPFLETPWPPQSRFETPQSSSSFRYGLVPAPEVASQATVVKEPKGSSWTGQRAPLLEYRAACDDIRFPFSLSKNGLLQSRHPNGSHISFGMSTTRCARRASCTCQAKAISGRNSTGDQYIAVAWRATGSVRREHGRTPLSL